MDRFEQAVVRHAAAISAVARKEYQKNGRGVVALTLAPDSTMVRYMPQMQPSGGPLDKALQMAAEYDPNHAAVVLVLEAAGGHDEAKAVMFMELSPETEDDPLSRGLELRADILTEAHVSLGEDQSFMNRNRKYLIDLGKSGWIQRGLGAVVVYRANLESDHWLVGHLEGKLIADEGFRVFFVPFARLIEGPVTSLENRTYDPKRQAVIVFIRSGQSPMTYDISF